MIIGGFQKTSLLDFPNKISAIVFTQGCNFKCGYCHNPELIALKNNSEWTEEKIVEFLKTRIGKLDGAVITGGEPCLQNGLKEFIIKVKNLGFAIKLDTNGTSPEKLTELLPYIDYIAMDIKAPLEKYSLITNTICQTEKIQKSINIIMNSGIEYEFRTTVVQSQLDLADFKKIGKLIKGAKKYYLQRFVATKTLDKKMMNENTYSIERFKDFIKILEQNIETVVLR